MNWNLIEGNWKELKGRFGEKWGKLTDDELTTIDGKREKLAGLLEQKYGIAKEHVEKQIAAFERQLDAGTPKSNGAVRS